MLYGQTQIDNAPAYPAHFLFAAKVPAYINVGVGAFNAVMWFSMGSIIVGDLNKGALLLSTFAIILLHALVHVYLAVRYRQDPHWAGLMATYWFPVDFSRNPNQKFGITTSPRFNSRRRLFKSAQYDHSYGA